MRLTGRTKLRALGRRLRGIEPGAAIAVALTDLDQHAADIQAAGFSRRLEIGETLLPAPCGTTSLFNAEGGEIVHTDRPMETAYYQVEWTWNEWHGHGTVERSKMVDVPYQRYPRTPIPPPGVELTVATDIRDAKVIICGALDWTPDNEVALLHRINLFRDLFGECELLTEGLAPFAGIPLRRVNWEILPPGEHPWQTVRTELGQTLRDLGERKGPAAEYRLRLLTSSHEPDFMAVGRAGFSGYWVFGFREKDAFIVESLTYGNATYVFGEDWEVLSQLTKADVIAGDLHKDRIIHREDWEGQIRELLR